MHLPVSSARICASVATVAFVLAVAYFGSRFEVYSQLAHPVAMLGATGVPRAGVFNALAYGVPGGLAACTALLLRERLGDGRWAARLGAQAVAFSGVAFALQGVWPLDSTDLFARSSRLHGAAWTFWWVAYGIGAVLLAWGLRGRAGHHWAVATAVTAAVTLAAALLGPAVLPVGLTQRVAFGAWFAGLLASTRISRSAA